MNNGRMKDGMMREWNDGKREEDEILERSDEY
jgi:hypothetical protein